MLQSLEVISVNLWLILISLANLIILFIIIKKFLYGPVKKVLAKRDSELNEQYASAREAERLAEESRKTWEEKLQGAHAEAEGILTGATEQARNREEKIIESAEERAEAIIRQAETEAELVRKNAVEGIKREIVAVSGVLAEKMLEREINTEDHHKLIDSFIEEIGEDDDENQ
ncbi:MAG: F0F1 ATP synthase subunit B [Ruminococcaceae bacterium]|nr:F0F1 ATP synthase subunit B [Oscillospiraceae bacterium]